MSGTNFRNYALRNKNLRNKNFGIELHRFYMSWIFGWLGGRCGVLKVVGTGWWGCSGGGVVVFEN